jgi:hypothetical protein
MQLPSEPGALVTVTPTDGGVAQEEIQSATITMAYLIRLVPADGFEPPTNGLQNRCSTPELSRHWKRIIRLLDAA